MVRRENQDRLRQIVAVDPAWSELFGKVEQMSVEESELWYWRYANEVVFQAGRTSAQYQHVVYEDLVQDPVSVMKHLYDACGLSWSFSVEESVRDIALGPSVANAWRKHLNPNQFHLVERFATGAGGFY